MQGTVNVHFVHGSFIRLCFLFGISATNSMRTSNFLVKLVKELDKAPAALLHGSLV